jgi:hypothetical protein
MKRHFNSRHENMKFTPPPPPPPPQKGYVYTSSSEGNRLRLYSIAWFGVVIITTPDRNRGTVLYLLDGRSVRV